MKSPVVVEMRNQSTIISKVTQLPLHVHISTVHNYYIHDNICYFSMLSNVCVIILFH